MALRYRRTKSLGHGMNLTVTNRGMRVGYRSPGRPGITVSEGTNGKTYLSLRIARGLWDVIKSGR